MCEHSKASPEPNIDSRPNECVLIIPANKAYIHYFNAEYLWIAFDLITVTWLHLGSCHDWMSVRCIFWHEVNVKKICIIDRQSSDMIFRRNKCPFRIWNFSDTHKNQPTKQECHSLDHPITLFIIYLLSGKVHKNDENIQALHAHANSNDKSMHRGSNTQMTARARERTEK